MPAAPVRSGGYLDLSFPKFRSGCYTFCTSPGSNAQNNALGNNALRLTPFFVPYVTAISRIGCEFTTAGEAASVFRLGIFAANISGAAIGLPGLVVLDAGTISTGTGDAGTVATGGTPGVYDIAVNVTLQRGWHWAGGAVQGAPTSQPNMRVVNGINLFEDPPLQGSSPAANTAVVGVTSGGVSGALANNPTCGPAGTSPARVFVKVA